VVENDGSHTGAGSDENLEHAAGSMEIRFTSLLPSDWGTAIGYPYFGPITPKLMCDTLITTPYLPTRNK